MLNDNNEKTTKIQELKSIRQINSQHIDERISIKGLVKNKTNPYFKVIKTIFTCENCGTAIEILQPTERVVYDQKKPASCPECDCRSLQLLKGRFRYKSIQEVILWDLFQKEDPNHIPLTIKVLLEGSLIDSVSCGEIIKIQGILKVEREDMEKNKFHPVILAEEIQTITYLDGIEITREDQEAIIGLSEHEHIHDMIVASIAPSISGYDHIKKAIALQLFGGTHKIYGGGILGGNINILIIGDPNTGKSQILENAAKIAPRSVYADNLKYKLHKSICKSKDDIDIQSGSRMESFLMEQLICIDHLNVHPYRRRGSFQELYSKTHISHILNTLCPVLAATNPTYDRFDRYKTLLQQINLPHSVLSKFDLVFLVEDKAQYEIDREIAKNFLEIRQKEKIEYLIHPELLSKYIVYAKRKFHPKITDKTKKQIEKYYLRMRHNFADEFYEDEFVINISLRHLDTLVKFAEASARIRLSNTVNSEDVNRAFNIMQRCFKEMGYDTGKINLDQWYQKSFNPK